MLPALVIGLREGVEASLIVGMIAAFLRRNGRSEALSYVLLGVTLAAAICLAIGIGLNVLEQQLPQRQQEQLETVVSGVAVVMVTYMVVWMRQHSRGMRSSLEDSARHALAQGSVLALVAMSFIAVFREGLETAVFLLAIFQSSTNATAAGAGAVAGLAIAVAIGYGIYRGGVHINLARFFKFTGVVLVLVAAGLVSSSLHTAHEAGWIDFMQSQVVDLTWLIKPGTVLSALVTGMLGIQSKPNLIETLGWAFYLVPVGAYVLWPQRIRRSESARQPSVEAGTIPESG